METLIFYVCAVAVIAGALGVVLAHNPVHSALFLLMTLVSVAVLFLQLDAALVAAIQVVVYASAIVVLFVFVITLLGVDKHESFDEPSLFQRPVAIVLGVLLFVQIVVLAGHHWVTGAHSARGSARRRPHRQRRDAREEPVHRLRLGVRDHRGAARDRGGRRRRARAPQRPARRQHPGHGERVLIAVASVTPTYYLTLAAALFTIGGVGLLVRRNTLVMFMCIELMLNAANLTFVAFAKALNDISGQVIVFFTLVVAAAEVAVGLAIIVAIFRRRQDVTADDLNALEG